MTIHEGHPAPILARWERMYELGFSVSEIYICKQCSYRSTDMRKMKKHVQKHRDAEGKE